MSFLLNLLTRRAHHAHHSFQILLPVDLKEIRTLIDLMKKNGLSVFKMEREGFKITLKTGSAETPPRSSPCHQPPALAASSHRTPMPQKSPAQKLRIIKRLSRQWWAPSTRRQSPEAAPYVTVGQEITPDTVVCIIEAMKVMNEIKAEISGVITEVCAENGKPVQFGQALFRVK